MKKIFHFLCFVMLSCITFAQTGNWTDEGNYDISWYDGNNSSTYHISTPKQLAGVAYLSRSKNMTFSNIRIVLENNVDMSAHYWAPIKTFSGTFDGDGHTISGLNITANEGDIGFIGNLKGGINFLKSASVYNLTLDNSCEINTNITNKDVMIGGIAGQSSSYSIVAACHFQGNLNITINNGDLHGGGLVGDMKGSVVSSIHSGNITVNANGTGRIECGGIAGVCNGKDIRITNCINNGTISAQSSSNQIDGISVGGITGTSYSRTTINTCLNTGVVKSSFTSKTTTYISIMSSGIACSNYGLIINCGNLGQITTSSNYKARSGGICASNSGSIVNCYNTENIICNGKANNAFYNNGGGIAGIHQYSSIGIRPLIYKCYNSGVVSSTGSDEQIGSIVGDASYLLEETDPTPEILSSFKSTETGKSIGYDYYNQDSNIVGIAPDLMTDESFLSLLNNDDIKYNDTTTTDKMHVWQGGDSSMPHFTLSDAYCSSTNYYTATFVLHHLSNRPSGEIRLRYKKSDDNTYTEVPWENGDELQIPTVPNAEYKYALVLKDSNHENIMPEKTFKTENVFEELSASTTINSANLLTLIKGDHSIINKVSFEISQNDTDETGTAIVTTVEGSPIDEIGFVKATISNLKPMTIYFMRVILETNQGTFYSQKQSFRTRGSGCLVKTLEHEITQTSMTFIHTVSTDNMDPSLILKESGCYYIHQDSISKYPENWSLKDKWLKAEGKPSEYNAEKNVFKTHFNNLIENCTYFVEHYIITENQNCEELMESWPTSFADIYPTLPVSASWELKNVTQTTAQLECSFVIGDANVIEKGLNVNGQNYIIQDGMVLNLTNLYPNSYNSVYAYIRTTNGLYKFDNKPFDTKPISVGGKVEEIGQTSALISVQSSAGDAQVSKQGVEWKVNGQTFKSEGSSCRITNLPANSNVSYRTFVTIPVYDIELNVLDSYYYSEWQSLVTKDIQVTIDKADACSNTSATLHALTECDTYSNAKFGFEWRKYDAPELVPSEAVIAQTPINGKLAFSLRGLSPNTYYKYRAFIKYQEKEYYSEWIGFGTADSFVLFPPTVQTITITSPDSTSVTLIGYVISGSEEILQKGFEYWAENSLIKGSEKQTVIVEGNEMKAEIHNLQPNTTYKYRSFAKTASGTTYGEEQSFTTGSVTAINSINEKNIKIRLTNNPVKDHSILVIDNTEHGVIAYQIYSLTGQLIKQETVNSEEGKTQITIYAKDYQAGTYIIRVIHNEKPIFIKMIIE